MAEGLPHSRILGSDGELLRILEGLGRGLGLRDRRSDGGGLRRGSGLRGR